MHELPAAFSALSARPQFILWRAVPRNDGTGKVDKKPISHTTGYEHNPHDPAIWMPADQALQILAAAQQPDLGVGFVFTEADPFFFFDIDDCLTPEGIWSDWANYLCGTFAGAAIEVSQSGKGLHIFGTGTPLADCKCKAKDSAGRPLPFDLYTSGRFAALTGDGVTGDASTDHTAALQMISAAYLSPGSVETATDWTNEPCEGYGGPEDDTELLARMLRSKSAAAVMGGRASVADLWERNEGILGANYPHDQGLEVFDHSKADIALCQHLAFWTGKDCERIDRLFRLSGLYRGKWEDREAYRQSTILLAVGRCTEVYAGSKRSEVVDPSTGEAPVPIDLGGTAPGETRSGYQYLAAVQQQEFFKDCVYILGLHKVLMPNGMLVKPDVFKTSYAGYVFAMDDQNSKITTNAWEAFTASQVNDPPTADSICFRPELEPRVIINEDGSTLVNTYTPIDTPRQAGDPAPFLGHLARLLPNKEDQDILLAYMAACIQYKGVKFQWAPLLQGCEGNGKTVFISCLEYAIGGKYTHLPDAADLGNKFNFWLCNKLFIGIEEIYVPAAKQEIIEALKPMITNRRIGVQGKGADQITTDNRANFFLCGNHKDGLRKTRNDRRYSIFYTAQQSPADIERDGMGGQYFPQLYNWLRSGGFAVVNEYLHTYAIPAALNPATECHRAPVTTSTTEALALSLGGVEQEVLEAIEEGRPGFAGGWVSSMAFDRMLEEGRNSRRIPVNKRRELLQGLGYDLHPTLPRGRVNNTIAFDNGKPRLYIKEGHISRNITKAAEVARAYLAAQGFGEVYAGSGVATG